MTKRIKILTLDISKFGGIERVTTNLANSFCEQGFITEIHSVFHEEEKPYYNVDNRVRINYFTKNKRFSLKNLLDKIKSHIILLKFAYKITRNSDNSIIISTSFNISVYLALFKNNNIILAAEHSQYYAHGIIARGVRLLAYRKINSIITLTESDKSIFDRKFKGKVFCIPNSVSFYPKQIIDKRKRVISIGRLVKEKGYGELIELYCKLGKIYKDWEFCIFGSGDLHEMLENLLKLRKESNNVFLYSSTKDVQSELLKSSLYICTSRTEAFPMIMLEAMACQLPIISFDCPVGPREIIINNVDGYLVENGNLFEMEASIKRLIDDPLLLNKFAQNARLSVRRYLPNNIMKKWMDVVSLYK